MFDKTTYTDRRRALCRTLPTGVALFLGNDESPMNYAANCYDFRQDSSFLYFFCLDQPGLAAVIDLDEGKDILFGDDVDIEDIIWLGPQEPLRSKAEAVGVPDVRPSDQLAGFLRGALANGRRVHFLPPYRPANALRLESLLGIRRPDLKDYVSTPLRRAVASLRSVKSDAEVAEIELALAVTHAMYQAGYAAARPGARESAVRGAMEGVARSSGVPFSFPPIISVRGETLHNHHHGNRMEKGHLLVMDSGAESPRHYAADITRTIPVGGRFTDRQRGIYDAVLGAQLQAIHTIRPGRPYREIHLLAARIITDHLKALGLMKGNTDDAVSEGAHALFFPHGLGHMIGLDVHDMEDIGEAFVGYDETVQRSDQFGLAYLRMAKALQSGFVVTVEPGIYFIPALIDQWRAECRHADFINYDKVEEYRDFGGIRIEDDVLVTGTANRVLGPPIPKSVDELENILPA